MIRKPSNQLEADLANKDALIIQAAGATNYLASVLCSAHSAFWSLPTDRLLAVLNSNIADTLEAFAANTALATACNSQLDAIDLPQFSNRAPTEIGRTDIVFNGQEFVYIAPPVIPRQIDPVLPEANP